jgi:outer membrane protein assembly factor BamB
MRRTWLHRALSLRLSIAILVVAALCLALTYEVRGVQATPAPSFSVTAGYPAPGNTLRLDGEHFIPGETATLYYDATSFATVKVVQTLSIIGTYVGGFWLSFTVPTSTTTGQHILKAVAQPSGLTAQTTITVKANWTQYGFTSANTRNNPYETSISTSNVANLTVAWTYTDPNTAGLFTLNTPSVSDGSIFFMTIADNMTFANDASTGANIWSVVNLFFPTGDGEPAAFAGTLYTTGYYLTAHAAASGVTEWTDTTQYDVPDAPTLSDGNLYVTSGGSLMDFSTGGKPVWTYTDALGSIIGTPAVANGSVYVGTSTGLFIVVDAATGKLQWTGSVANFPSGPPVVDNGMVFIAVGNLYASSATLYAFDAAGCGSPTCNPAWTATIGQQFGQGAAVNLAVGDGTVFVSSTDWNLYAFAESGCGSATCSPIWKGQTAGRIESAPALANGVVYVGSDDDTSIHAFNALGCGSATCQPIWSYNVGTEVESSPIVVNGMIYVAPRGRTLYAFHLGSTARPRAGSVRHSSKGAWPIAPRSRIVTRIVRF